MSLEDCALLSTSEDVSSIDYANGRSAFFHAGGDTFIPGKAYRGSDVQWSPKVATSDGLIRTFDIIFSLAVMIAVAPVFLLLVLLLQIDSRGPVFFVQQRVGRNGILFPCFKLRTMLVDSAERLEQLLKESPEARAEWDADHKLKNDPRVTKLGRVARLFSLDELPQLANILLGHMSVVGPRPIVEAEIWRYGSAFADYCLVRPGLTGLWQVSGRNDVSYDERVRLDREYARSKCLRLDLEIIARTFNVVLGARGAY